jgi:hypothetical protein
VSDRLEDLKRQRALAQEQAAALEREIAREMGSAVPPPAAAPASPTAPASDDVGAYADRIIEQYTQQQRPIRDQVKSGCLFYFFTALALVALGVVAIYLLARH